MEALGLSLFFIIYFQSTFSFKRHQFVFSPPLSFLHCWCSPSAIPSHDTARPRETLAQETVQFKVLQNKKDLTATQE